MSFLTDPPLHDFPDRAIRRALEHPHNLRDLVQAIAPELAPRFDFDRLQVVKRSFLLEDWRGRESDILYLIPFRAGAAVEPVLVCLLLEHQSRADPRMPLRMLLYAVLYWERQWKEWEERHAEGEPLRLTPILPIVFHTASRPWGSNRTLAELIAGPEELRPYLPAWNVLFWDLSQRSPDELLAAPGAFVQLLSVVRTEDADAGAFRDCFTRTVQQLETLAKQDKMRWTDLLWLVVSWALQRRPQGERAPLVDAAVASQTDQALREEVRTMSETAELTWMEAMSRKLEKEISQRLTGELTQRIREEVTQQLREEITQQNRAEGKAEGERDTLREVLRTLLAERFGPLPPAVLQQVQACEDAARLKEAIRQTSHLGTLADVHL